MTTKVCRKCKAVKPTSEFNAKRTDCKTCENPQSVIYIIVHPLWPEYCKVGHTSNTARRLSTLNGNDPLGRYRYFRLFNVPRALRREIERAIHKQLAPARSPRGEWFHIAASDAAWVVQQFVYGTNE